MKQIINAQDISQIVKDEENKELKPELSEVKKIYEVYNPMDKNSCPCEKNCYCECDSECGCDIIDSYGACR